MSELKVKFTPIPSTHSESFKKVFTGYKDGLVKSDPGGFVMTPLYGQNADKIYNIEPRSDDVWLLTCPKAGTTWVSEMLWLMMNNCDFETALKQQLLQRTFFPEMGYLLPQRVDRPFALEIDKKPSPRIIKSHLPFYLLHPGVLETAKVVYVARNPKDVIVSFYYHHRLVKFQGCEGSVDDFAQYFLDNEVIYTPFFPHVLDAWSKRHHPNMHFIFYEELKKDLGGQLEKLAKFLGKEVSKEQLERLKDHLKFESIEKNEAVNNEGSKKSGTMNQDGKFIRKGIVGDWKNHFSPEMNQKLDSWIEKNLARTDLKFFSELENFSLLNLENIMLSNNMKSLKENKTYYCNNLSKYIRTSYKTLLLLLN